MNIRQRVQAAFNWIYRFVVADSRLGRIPGVHVPLSFRGILKTWLTRETARWLCLVLFFLPFAIYLLEGWDQLQDRPQALDVGVVAVAAALGGLVLNAGLNLKGDKRRETILVAQKFIIVVIMMILFVPALHFVGLIDGVDTNAVELDSLQAGAREFFFWLSAALFYGGTVLFIVALVDLAYAMVGIADKEHAHQKCPCDDCSDSDAS